MSAPSVVAPQKNSFLFQWLRELVPHNFHEINETRNQSSSLATQLSAEGWPLFNARHRDLGVLIINTPSDKSYTTSLVKEFASSTKSPYVIILNDEATPAIERCGTYSHLSASGFRYAGTEQSYSIWTRLTEIPSPPEPADVSSQRFPLTEQQGQACFDALVDTDRITATGRLNLSITGWAFLSADKPIPPVVTLERLNLKTSAIDYIPAIRTSRPDVAAHFKKPSLLMSGFEAIIPMRKAFPDGFRLRIVQSDGSTVIHSPVSILVYRGNEDFEQSARAGLARKFLRGSGIEIGALQRKLTLPSNCTVRYIDRMSLHDLTSHYPELQGLPLQAPDIIDDGESLHSIVEKSLDFVIANHFFEHCENPVLALQNLLKLLKRFGILYMAVPDKRYTFDSERPSTRFEVLRETYTNGKRPDRVPLYREWVRFVERNESAASEQRTSDLLGSNYSIHYNVWCADEFLSFLIQARQEFQLTFNISSTVCVDNEVIVLLEQAA